MAALYLAASFFVTYLLHMLAWNVFTARLPRPGRPLSRRVVVLVRHLAALASVLFGAALFALVHGLLVPGPRLGLLPSVLLYSIGLLLMLVVGSAARFHRARRSQNDA